MVDIPANAAYLKDKLLDDTGLAAGAEWYFDGTDWVLRTIGASGRVMVSDGTKGAWAELDGDTVDIDGTPTNYTPNATSPASDADDLWAHLLGIDDEIGSIYTAISTVDGDTIDIDGTPTGYTPNNTAPAADAADLWAHLLGISDQFNAISPDVEGTAGEALDQYEIVYQATSDGKWYLALTGGSTEQATARGIVLESGGISQDSTGTIRLRGLVTNGAWSYTPGDILYLSATPGAFGTSDTGVQLAYALTATQIWFQPGSGSGSTGSGATGTVTGTAGELLSEGDVVYGKVADGKFWKAQQDGSSAEADACGLVTESGGILADATGEITLFGVVTVSSWSWTSPYLKDLWLGPDYDIVETEPATGYHKPLGKSLDGDTILWLPQTGWADPLAPNEGDLMVGNSGGAWEQLAAGSEGDLLRIVSGVPDWDTVTIPTASDSVESETSFGISAAAGSAATFSRSDHTHGTPAAPSVPSASDSVASETSWGVAASAGSSTDYSRADHTHGTPADPGSAAVMADAIGGRIYRSSDTALLWQFVENNQAMLYSNSGSDWQLVKMSSEPSAANTATDLNGDALAADVNYDVFLKYSSSTAATLEFAQWAVSTAGSSARYAAWVTSTDYDVGDRVSESGSYYACVEEHNSGTFSTDLSAGKWVEVTGTGDNLGLGILDGVPIYANSGAWRDYRYVGAIRLRSDSGAKFTDQTDKRYISNRYNQAKLVFGSVNPYSASASETGLATSFTSWVSNGDTWKGSCLLESNRLIHLSAGASTAYDATYYFVSIGIGRNGKTPSSYCNVGWTTTFSCFITSNYTEQVSAGYHEYWPLVEASNGGAVLYYWYDGTGCDVIAFFLGSIG